MSAPVRIEAEAWTDLRFATLARLLGLADADHALIRTARLWSWQAEHFTPEAPTYVVDLDTIESALGAGGAAAALVRSRLAEEVPDGFRIRGARGRIEWLHQRREAARAGGEATRRKHGYTEEPLGPPVARPSGEPNRGPLVPALVPDPEKISPSARAIPPTPVHGGHPGTRQPEPRATQQEAATPGLSASSAAGNVAKPQTSPTPDRAGHPPSTGTFSPDDPRSRGRLAEATYRRVSDALVAIALELKLPAPLPFPAVTPGSHPQSLRELQDRVREEGAAAPLVCDRVVANLVAQAREERSVEWLAEKAFSPRPWAAARQWTRGAAARRRGPAKGDPLPPAPAPKRDPALSPVVVSASEREEARQMAAELRDRLSNAARAPPKSALEIDRHPGQQPQPKAAT